MFFLFLFSTLLQADDTDFINVWKLDMSIRLNPKAVCVLRRPVAEALSRAQSLLRLQDLGLKVLNCYCPKSLDPKKVSKLSRGASVEVKLVDRQGEEVRDPDSKKNLLLLKKALTKEGFIPSESAGGHFDYKGWDKFEMSDIPLSQFP